MNRSLPSRQYPHRGFTLVEIMIALALGLLLMLGVAKLFVGNSEGYRLQSGVARMQENGRFALDILKRDVGQAGFPRGTFATPITGSDGPPDSITVYYQSTTDCLGQTLLTTTATNKYGVTDLDGDGIRSLVCKGNGSSATQALVDGISDMQILYGLDTDGDPVPNRYVSATDLAGAWDKVVSVRVTLVAIPTEEAPSEINKGRTEVFTSTIPLRN